VALLLDRPDAIPVSALTGSGLEKAAAVIERMMFDEGVWQRKDPQSWEEYEKAGKEKKKRADSEKTLDDDTGFWQ
jgi:hypothetical protein